MDNIFSIVRRGASSSEAGPVILTMGSSSGINPQQYAYQVRPDGIKQLAAVPQVGSGRTNDHTFSPDGAHLMVPKESSPYVVLYKRSGETFSQITGPSEITYEAWQVAYSKDGMYLSIASNQNWYTHTYKRSGDTYTKLTTPDLSYQTRSVAWHPDGDHVIFTCVGSPYYVVLKRSGDTFTALTAPLDVGPADGSQAAYSPDGTHLYLAEGRRVRIYTRSGDTYAAQSWPTDLPTSYWIHAIAVSPDSKFVAIGYYNNAEAVPYFRIYSRSGNTLTQIPDLPGTRSTSGTGADVAWSDDGQYFALAASGTQPAAQVWRRDGDSFTQIYFDADVTLPTSFDAAAFCPTSAT